MAPTFRRSILAVALLAGTLTTYAFAQITAKKEIDTAYAPLEVIKRVLDGVLTPRGKFLLLAKKGGILVIDAPEGILAAEQAIAAANLPKPIVSMDFEFITGLPQRRQTITHVQEVPVPVEFDPPTIFLGPSGTIVGVIPPTPTRFETRNIGVTSETVNTFNPDGSVTIDNRTESSQFEGFINYGSAVLPVGGVGALPVNSQVGDPNFFVPYLTAGGFNLPVISTTRITTSVVIRPRLELGIVHLDMLPRLLVESGGPGVDPGIADLKEFRVTLPVLNHQIGRIHGFIGADDDFNRRFFGARDPHSGSVSIVLKVSAVPPSENPGPVSPSPK